MNTNPVEQSRENLPKVDGATLIDMYDVASLDQNALWKEAAHADMAGLLGGALVISDKLQNEGFSARDASLYSVAWTIAAMKRQTQRDKIATELKVKFKIY